MFHATIATIVGHTICFDKLNIFSPLWHATDLSRSQEKPVEIRNANHTENPANSGVQCVADAGSGHVTECLCLKGAQTDFHFSTRCLTGKILIDSNTISASYRCPDSSSGANLFFIFNKNIINQYIKLFPDNAIKNNVGLIT